MLLTYFRSFTGFLMLLGVLGLAACESDFDPNAPYRETTVIYGLIDPQDTVHFVKVNKAFLNTKTNAMTIAATQPDSSYHYDSITVTLLELRKGPDSLLLNTYPMHPVRVKKDPGLFNDPDQMVYSTGRAKLNEKSVAKIVVKNTATGKVVSGATSLVPYFCIQQMGFNPPGWGNDCNSPTKSPLPVEIERKISLAFTLSPDAVIYKGVYQIYFTEITGNDSTHKMLPFQVFADRVYNAQSSQPIKHQIDPFTIADFLDSEIDVSGDDNSTYRISDSVVAVVTAGTNDLYTYISVNNVFSAVTQTRPEFTNIKGDGTGLFTSRRMQRRRGYFPLPSLDTITYLYPHLKFRHR